MSSYNHENQVALRALFTAARDRGVALSNEGYYNPWIISSIACLIRSGSTTCAAVIFTSSSFRLWIYE